MGSHTVRRLAGSGFHPVVLDNLSEGHRSAVVAGDFIEGDIAQAELLEELFQRYRFHAVMHFSGRCYVGESMTDPLLYYRENVAKTLPLFETMLRHRVGRFILSSSCAVYGIPEQMPISEDHPCRPVSPYGQSKKYLEEVLQSLQESDGLRFIALRYFNAAGASQDGVLGESHHPETHLIPRTLRAVLGEGPPVVVFGTDYPTPDGTCIRDYVHVEDLAEGHVAALDWMEREARSEVFNLGTGKGWSVREVIDAAGEACGRPVPIQQGPRRPGDPAELVADASKAARLLGWKAQMPELATIIGDAWRWYQNPKY